MSIARFDKQAQEWDKNPQHLERSKKVAAAMMKLCPTLNGRALEFGAGTAILSFLLRESFDEIVMIDNSHEMVNVMTRKVEHAHEQKRMKPIYFNLDEENWTGESFDVVFTQMVLHHVPDTFKILKRFAAMLKPGGRLFIADLHSEDGTFHDDEFIGHNGFDLNELTKLLYKASFIDITHENAFIVEKMRKDTIRHYDGFLLMAQKES
ncbi:MAG: class I SAM-dependent methyltransferase [Marinilabiliaceae bacterium]|nr:class I SAM-dependent methyltransferase [Marinilabiliaceae bacterium]